MFKILSLLLIAMNAYAYTPVVKSIDTVDSPGGTLTLSALPSGIPYSTLGVMGAATISSPLAFSAGALSIPAATNAVSGYLSAADHTSFAGAYTLPAFTAGSILFSDGSTIAQDNANLFWDDTNQKLGVGTNTPLATEHIVAKHFSTTGSTIINTNVITVADPTGIVPGMWVSDSAGAFTNSNWSPTQIESLYIVSLVVGNNVTVSQNASSTQGVDTFTFFPQDWLQADYGNPARKFSVGEADSFGRPSIKFWAPNNMLILGGWQVDGQPYNVASQGLVTYFNSFLGTPLGVDGNLMLFGQGQILNLNYDGGIASIAFNSDQYGTYIQKADGTTVFNVDRPTGNTTISGSITNSSLGAGVVHSSAGGVYTSSAVSLISDVGATVLPIANGGTNNATAYTAGSVVYADGTSLTQNNTDLFWDNTNKNLKINNGLVQTDYVDPFSRNALWAHQVNQTLELGSWQSDGMPVNANSEGEIVYGDEALAGVPIAAGDGSYARIKAGRFGLFSVSSTIPFYAGGQYWYRVDPTEIYFRDNAGNKVFNVQRSSGNTVIGGSAQIKSLTAGLVKSDASGNLSIASSGSDYAPATSGSAPLKGNGSGGFSAATSSDIVGLFSTCSGSQYLGADGSCHNAGGSGTVTSVTFTGDGTVLSSTPSTAVTTSGTVTATLNTVANNYVLAGPTAGGPLAPTYRLLVAADIPALPYNASSTKFQEVPTGSRNNSNQTFGLAHTPINNASVSLYMDGLILVQGTDYTISGATITTTMASPPNFGETLYAVYEY